MAISNEQLKPAHFLAGLAVIALVLWLVIPDKKAADAVAAPIPQTPAPAAPAAQVPIPSSTNAIAEEAEFNACQKKMIKAQKLEVLYDIDLKSIPKIYVGPTFFTMPIDAKQGFADTANCLLSGGATGEKAVCIPMTFYHWQTGKEVGEYSLCKLKML